LSYLMKKIIHYKGTKKSNSGLFIL